MSIMESLALFATRKSWKASNALNFSVVDGAFRVPITKGVGRTLLGGDHPIRPLIEHVYASRNGAFVDIGANIGHVMRTLANIDRSVRYIGFEPLIQAATYIQELIDVNGLSETHTIYPVALSDEVGSASIMMNSASDVSATITDDGRPVSMYAQHRSVPVMTGDAMLHYVDRVAAIKVDVEGAELSVLKGLSQTLETHRPALILEIMPTAHLESGQFNRSYFGDLPDAEVERLVENRKRHAGAIYDFLSGRGYDFYQWSDGRLSPSLPSESTVRNQDFLALPATE